ncbi:flagellar basal-body rod protein FlgF [Castellaniella sp.]|uniref:flagellar basal-body rod protein FlgF n=1 Tax=Castellaniella sp. TaxID=1955812 RepID=UPI00355DF9E5
MDRILYVASGGAARILEQQSAIANNLANVATPGFRAALDAYRAVPLQPHAGELPTRVSTVLASHGADLAQGALAETGGALDVALAGEGWFAVRTPEGEAYTRAGGFTVNAEGLLVTATGAPVLSVDGQPIEMPERGTPTIAEDGQISVLGAGDKPADLQLVGQLKLVNPPAGQLQRRPDGLFELPGGQAAPADDGLRILPGFIEKSNVDPAGALVALIANARAFEQHMKFIQSADENDQRSNAILSAAN